MISYPQAERRNADCTLARVQRKIALGPGCKSSVHQGTRKLWGVETRRVNLYDVHIVADAVFCACVARWGNELAADLRLSDVDVEL